MIYWIFFFVFMGVIGRMAGNGFGSKWGVSFLPELLHSIPYGMAFAWSLSTLYEINVFWQIGTLLLGTLVSYGGMQSGTWMFLRWESHDDPNTERSSTMKPVIDFMAGIFGFKLGDEGYAWIAAMIKGFIIGLPVGGVITAFMWALGYEIGSHAKGRVEFDPHIVSEFSSAFLGGISIFLFTEIIKWVALNG